MFLNWQQGLIQTGRVDLNNVLFLYDPATNKDLVTGTTCGVVRANTPVDSVVMIDGNPTLKAAVSTSGVAITFPTPIDLGILDEWTIEWAAFPTSVPANYATEMLMNYPGGGYIGARWTDAGFGARLQFTGGGFGNAATIWRIPTNYAQASGHLARYAMVYKDGLISVYKDGVKQTMNNGTGQSTSSTSFPKAAGWQPFTTMNLGWINSTYISWLGNYGRVRISSTARYLANYTPQPI
ncbi:hypothetical protein D3C73_1087660 [compost metagenome]